MADSLAVSDFRWAPFWGAAYRRIVQSSFATVPLYRELWALHGRTEPVLVPGRTGRTSTDDGAITAAEAVRKRIDLVPLGGGDAELDPLRGLGAVLAMGRGRPRRGELVVVLRQGAGARPPTDLPRGVRWLVLDPQALPAGLAEQPSSVEPHGGVLAVGADAELAALARALPDELARRLARVPARGLDELVGELDPHDPSDARGVLHDETLGYLGARGACGHWHLDWRRVYARRTGAGLAFTLLRQRSPRLVDVLVAGSARADVAPCPRHRTPVVRA